MRRHLYGALSLLVALTAASRASAGSFVDDHDLVGLHGWAKVGGRGWTESRGLALPADAQGREGFLITEYPSSNDGTLEATLVASDPWNAQHGGLVFRWTSASSYYFVSVKPGNQWDSALLFGKDSTDPGKATVVARNLRVGSTFTLKVAIQGSTFVFSVDGLPVATVTDGDHPAGRVGYGYSSQWNRYVSFERLGWQDAPGSAAPTVKVVPGAVDPAKVKLEVHLLDEGLGEANIIKPRLYVQNVGAETVDAIRFYYYFTVAEHRTPILEPYYAPDTRVSLADLGNDQWAIEYVATGIHLAPGGAFPDTSGLVVGVHFEDWTPMDRADDFSNPGSRSFVVTDKVPVYLLDAQAPAAGGTTGTTPATGDSPVSGSNPKAQVAYQHLTLERLHCNETESWWEDDKAVVAVYMDGQFVRAYGKHDMDDGDDWDINDGTDLYFQEKATLRLFDHDGWSIFGWDLDPDDAIATLEIPFDSINSSGWFRGDDAEYWITYDNTTEYFDEDVKGPEDIAYNNLRNSTATGVWPSIPDKATVVSAINDQLYRVWPRGINVYQGKTNKYGTCGPTAVVYGLVTRSPLRYVIAVRDLYLGGRLHGALDDIVPPASVRSQTVDDELPADLWILYASMKGDRNGDFAGGDSGVGDLKDWLTNLSGYQYTEYVHTFLYGETDALEEGIDVIDHRNGVALVNVNAKLLQDNPSEGGMWGNLGDWPDHWVYLVAKEGVAWGTDYVADDGSVSFDVYNGALVGEIRHVTVNETTFEDYFWGAVYGW